MSQLILDLEDNLLQAAQEYARQQGQDLSALVAQLLRTAVRPAAAAGPAAPSATQALSPRIQRLFGAVKAPADFDYKQALEEGLQERYGV